MTAILTHVIETAVTAGFVVLAVLLLRLPLKKAPRFITVALWGVVALRLICPVSIESAVSIVPSTSVMEQAVMPPSKAPIGELTDSSETIPSEPQTPTIVVPDTPPAKTKTVSLSTVLFFVWVGGVAVMLTCGGVSSWRLHRRVREAVKEEGRVYRTEAIASPFVMGIIRPRIYLPFSLEGEACDHVLAHERAHIKRGDHLIKPLGFLLLAVYWFQPLLWVAYILLCRDIEAACDERVVRDYSKEERQQYSYALVSLGVHRRMIAACPVAFGEVGVKARVKSVMHYKKPAVWILAAAVLISAVASVCLLTDRTPTVGATLEGGTLTVTTDSGFAAKEFSLEEGTRISIRDHTPEPFTATIDKVDDKHMEIVLDLDTPLYLNGIKTTTVTVPFDEEVVLQSIEPYDGVYGTYTFTIALPSATEDEHFPMVSVWTSTAKTHTRYEGETTTLILTEDYFLLDFGARSDYVMKGTYAYADNTLILTEDAHLTEYVFDIGQDGELAFNENASYRHERAKTQSLVDGETIAFCYAYEKGGTLKNAAGEVVAAVESDTAHLYWRDNGIVELETSELIDGYSAFRLLYVDMATEQAMETPLYVIAQNSTMFVHLFEENGACGLVVCGINNDFGAYEAWHQPKELLRVTLEGVSSLIRADAQATLSDDEEIVVTYYDDDGNERIVAYNIRTHKPITRRILTFGGGYYQYQYGSLNRAVYRDNFDILGTGAYRGDPSGRVLYYKGITRAAVYLDGAYTDLRGALKDGRLTIEQLEELCKADAAAYLVEGGVTSYRDGGTTVYSYKYEDEYHHITFRHKTTGDQDVYVGEMAV